MRAGTPKRTYQEHNRDVEQESAQSVEEEREETDVVNLIHAELGKLPEQGDHTVHHGADGSEVVQRDQGVHLELGRAQETLNHGKTQGLEDDASDLVDDSDPDKLDLSHRGDDDTNDDDRDIKEHLEVRLGNTERPAGDEHGDRSSGLVSSIVSKSAYTNAGQQ